MGIICFERNTSDQCFLRQSLADGIGPSCGQLRLWASQKASTDLDSRGAEDQCCRDAARIGNTTSGDHGYVHSIDNGRKQ